MILNQLIQFGIALIFIVMAISFLAMAIGLFFSNPSQQKRIRESYGLSYKKRFIAYFTGRGFHTSVSYKLCRGQFKIKPNHHVNTGRATDAFLSSGAR